MKAFLIGNKSICALPGGCHPVVASRVSELLYLCGLAGKGEELLMREFLEFRYLKSFEYGFRQLGKDFFEKVFSREKWERFCPSLFFYRRTEKPAGGEVEGKRV